MSSPADSLPAGAILYSVKETCLISAPTGGTNAQFRSVKFAGSNKDPQAVLGDPIELGEIYDIRHVRACNRWEAKQEVVLLTKSGVSAVALEDQKPRLTKIQAKVDDAVLIIGFDPIETLKRRIALLVRDGAGFAVTRVDLDSGQREAPLRLPPQVRGDVVAAELLRRGSSTILVLVTIADLSLAVHALAWGDLSPKVDSNRVKTLALGNTIHNLPNDVVASGPWNQQAVTVARMRPASTDEQLAVAWGVTETELEDPKKGDGPVKTAAMCKIALVEWGSGGEPIILASATADLVPAPPNWAGYRLAAGDLLHDGSEQLVFGYLNQLPSPNPSAGAVLMLFTLDESSGRVANLKYHSKCALNADTVLDLPELSAGVFGDCMGVQVTALRSEDFNNSLSCCFVPVDPNLGLPTGTESISFTNLVALEFDAPPSYSFSSDLGGQTLVLGSPVLEHRAGCGQILAIIQAPPFDRRIMATPPSVTFAINESGATGFSVSSDKTWSLSDDTSYSLGLGPLSLTRSIHNSYLNSLNQTSDRTTTSNIQFHSNLTDQDYLLVYTMSCDVWRYPVLRSSVKNAVGELLVIFPQDPKTDWIAAHTYGYRPRSEVGMLLSYVHLEREAYSEENRLFKLQGIMVTEKSDSATITFDQSTSSSNMDSRHISVLNSVSSHISLSGNTELFSYLPAVPGLPATFGLNLGTSRSYSESSVQTTHLTVHSSMSLTVTGGAVKDPIYEYVITPCIYQHARLGCLMLTWQVDLAGRAWRSAEDGGDRTLTSPQLCLIRPVTQSVDLLYETFSRSISFVENSDGTIDIVVEIFNNSLATARDVSCEFFLGKPELVFNKDTHVKEAKAPQQLLGRLKLDGELKPVQRRKVTLGRQKLSKPIYVTVKLYLDDDEINKIYWGVHPPEKFFA